MAKKKYIESPEKMWEYFCKYRTELKENPKYLTEQKKGGVTMKMDFQVRNKKDIENIRETFETFNDSTVRLPYERPLTLEGFENWCADQNIISDLGDYFSNKNDSYSDYSTICSRIRKVIRQDQIEGGMIGMYNPSITQRLNGLVDKQDVTTGGDKINAAPATFTVQVITPEFDD